MPGNKRGGKGNQNQKGGDDFKFDFGGEGKAVLNKETQAALMPVLQGKLDKLVGKDSGYMATLPQSVQQRIKALKKLQDRHDSFEEEFRKEFAALDKKYEDLKAPLKARRSDIVNGVSEPTAEELAGDEEKESGADAAKPTEKGENIKGIPEFWLVALKHHPEIDQLIMEEDEEALKHLTDIKVVFPDEEAPDTFMLEFHFSENDFFTNKLLTKTFVMSDDMLQDIDATPIEWKAGKNLCFKMVTKTVASGKRGRGGRGGRGGNSGPPKKVTEEQPIPSFFHLFDELDMEEIGMENPEDAEDILQSAYETGMVIRDEVISDAVRWFTGEVEMGGEDEDEDDDEEEDDDEDEAPKRKTKPAKKTTAQLLDEDVASDEDAEFDPKADPKAQPECKQQ